MGIGPTPFQYSISILKRYRSGITLNLITSISESFAAIGVAHCIKTIFDSSEGTKHHDLFKLVGVFCILVALRFCSTYFRERLNSEVQKREFNSFVASVQPKLTVHLDRFSKSDLLHHIHSDARIVFQACVQGWGGLISANFRAITIIVYLFSVSHLFVLFGLLIPMVMLPLIMILRKKQRANARRFLTAGEKLFSQLKNFIYGHDLHAVAGIEGRQLSILKTISQERSRAEIEMGSLHAFQPAVMEVSKLGFIVLIYTIWSESMISGGTSLATLYLGLQLLAIANATMWSLQTIQPALASYERIKPYIISESAETTPRVALPCRLSHLRIYKFEGQKNPFIGPINLELKAGEIINIYGASGSGKTTLLRALSGLHPHVQADNHPYPEKFENTGYLSHTPFFWEGTLAENLLIDDREPPENLDRLLDGLQLEKVWTSLTDGLDTHIEGPNQKFSRGELQRLALLRECIRQPELLLLDEPTTGLEDDLAVSILSFIAKEMGSGCLVITSHHPIGADVLVPSQSIQLTQRSTGDRDVTERF